MMSSRKLNPRTAYRMSQQQRVQESASLAERFPALKSLQINLEYFDRTGATRNGGMKYKANLEHAKSMLYFNCVHGECVGGDFDLTGILSKAVAAKAKAVNGELRCQGTRAGKGGAGRVACNNILRYKLTLVY